MPHLRPHRLYTFGSPYKRILPLADPASLGPDDVRSGAVLVWMMGTRFEERLFRSLRWRRAGIPLIVVAPPARELETDDDLLRVLEHCRPMALLPHHDEPSPLDLQVLIAQPPDDLPAAVVDYLGWRGLVLDLDMRRLLRRTVELSAELRTVAGLSRGVYLSRRALGRRFVAEGLPVPSHWLHFSRLLRAVLMMQSDPDNLMSIAFRLSYPDAFALSNQMKRLTGLRPSEIRGLLGWEWFVEAWIQEEIRTGGFNEDSTAFLHARGAVARPVEDEDDEGDDPPHAPAGAALRRESA